MKVSRTVATMICLCLIMSVVFVGFAVNFGPASAQGTAIYIEPTPVTAYVCDEFTVEVKIRDVMDLWVWEFVLSFNPSQLECLGAIEGPFLMSSGPTIWPPPIIDNNAGTIDAGCARIGPPPGSSGSGTLAYIQFHCKGQGVSDLIFIRPNTYLLNSYMESISFTAVNGYVIQIYMKPRCPDYAPSGVPDFDQRQDKWTNPNTGKWSWCGPIAVANSLWWMDSYFEPNPIPPPTINDGFPLLTAYGLWDDHDPRNLYPFADNLAWLMDTDGRRTGIAHNGTFVRDMEWGIDQYLMQQGLYYKFYEQTVPMPTFEFVAEEVEKCEDVILLLGFWQSADGVHWTRVGGHYVTVAGVDHANRWVLLSDPMLNNAEPVPEGTGGPGRVLPVPHGPPYPHSTDLHNDTAYVSHDSYMVGQSPSPGNPGFGLPDYPYYYWIENFVGQNFEELGPYVPGLMVFTEVEYAVTFSCKTGLVAAGSEDTNIYVWDFFGNFQWQFALANPVVSVAMDNDGRFIAAGTRSPGVPFTGGLWLFDTTLGGPPGNILWAYVLPVSTSYDGGWMGTESKSVDVKYNNYNGYVVVAGATDRGLYLYEQSGGLVWQYYDEAPETIVRISQDGNYIICADYNTGFIHYFSHLRDGVPGWGPNDGVPVWTQCGGIGTLYGFWVAISGNGDYVAVSVYPNPVIINPMLTAVTLFNRTGSNVWFWILNKGGYVRVDMPCNGRSVVSVNDDPSNGVGADLNYWSDGGNGWDGGDAIPVWSYSTGIATDDFYTVTISENGDNIAAGGIPRNTYLLTKTGVLAQTIGLMPGAIQSSDLTFSGKYGASVDNSGTLWFFSNATGFMWSWSNPSQAPFHCVAVSKIYPCMFPYPNHDVSIITIKPWKTIVGQGYICKFNVTVANEGDFAETFYVTLCANSTVIGTLAVNNLLNGATAILTFSWDTTGFAKGNYTVWAVASIVADEIDVYDNTFTYGLIKVTIPGDVDGDFRVTMGDIVLICDAFGSTIRSDGNYWHAAPCVNCPHSPNCDIDCDGKITMGDIIIACDHFGQHYP